jgi:signal transduction histidine kinase
MERPGAAHRFLFASFVSILALLLSLGLQSFAGRTVFDFFYAAVALSAWYGGFGPGTFASSFAVLALDYYFIPPLHTLELGFDDLLRLIVFGFVALLISTLSARLREAKARLERSQEDLENRVKDRTAELSRVNTDLSQEISHRLESEKELVEISNREQRRLGQDLHDGLCQILAGVRLMTEKLQERLSSQASPETSEVARIESRLSEALAQADTISRGLYPVELETNGLESALYEMAEKISKIYPVNCSFENSSPVTWIDTAAAHHLYRIAQEAVINAIKSGKAKRIVIRLGARAKIGILSITDNGVGFQSSSARQGMGLKIMNYRARMINATLHIRPLPRGGTRVACAFRPQATNSSMLTGDTNASR